MSSPSCSAVFLQVVAPSALIASFFLASFGHGVWRYSFSFICFRCFGVFFISFTLLPSGGVSVVVCGVFIVGVVGFHII